MYNLCIFDLDGTLTDPYEGLVNGIDYAVRKLGIGGDIGNPRRFIGPPLQESFKEAFGLTDPGTERAVNVFREYYGETGLFENKVYPGIVDLLEKLKAEGIRLAVATSKPDKFAHVILKHFELDKHFDVIIGDADDGSMSLGGKKTLIKAVLDTLDPGRGKDAVMIGDRKHDIIGASETGIDSIGVLWGYGSREEFEQAGATWIAAGTDELYRYITE